MSVAVEFRRLSKAFGPVVANADVDLKIGAGSIHGIVGENGAGKSTAMKMLYGQYAPDSGEIWVDGKLRHWSSPSDAIDAGIGMVHQHFMLAAPYSVLDNIIVGAEHGGKTTSGFLGAFKKIDRSAARKKLEALSKQYGMPVDLDAPIYRLPVGVQQRVEILKLLYRDAKILILDEPTAVLTPQEIQELFANLKKLKDEGKTVLIITHKLKEVLQITDRVTVFRAGRVTGEVATQDTSVQELAELMVGRKVLLRVEVPEVHRSEDSALHVQNLSLLRSGEVRHKLKNISFQVRFGEVVGIAGVEGNGQSELIQAILHPSDSRCRTSGSVKIFGNDVTDFDAREIRSLGVGVIAEDRHKEAILLERPLTENYLLGHQRSLDFIKNGLIDWRKVRQSTEAALEQYDVRPRVPEIAVGRLSGGNQQKLVVARELYLKPRFLIAAQPTRGVDVGAIEFIHRQIIQARTSGAGVLLVSSELDEVMGLADRILVIFEGQMVGEFKRGQADEKELGLRMGGAGHA